MTKKLEDDTTVATEDTLQQLRDVRRGLIQLHKTLLDAERIRYERLFGRVEGGGVLLQLLIHDPWFGWLRPLSALIVQVDERLDADEPVLASEARAFIDQVRSILRPDEAGDVFAEHYFSALQQTPDVVMAHRAVTRCIKPPSAGEGR